MKPLNMEIWADKLEGYSLLDWRIRQGVEIRGNVMVLLDADPDGPVPDPQEAHYMVLDAFRIPGGTQYYAALLGGPEEAPPRVILDHSHVVTVGLTIDQLTQDQPEDFRDATLPPKPKHFSVHPAPLVKGWATVVNSDGDFVLAVDPTKIHPQHLVQLLDLMKRL
jgi:hypothetical protein